VQTYQGLDGTEVSQADVADQSFIATQLMLVRRRDMFEGLCPYAVNVQLTSPGSYKHPQKRQDFGPFVVFDIPDYKGT